MRKMCISLLLCTARLLTRIGDDREMPRVRYFSRIPSSCVDLAYVETRDVRIVNFNVNSRVSHLLGAGHARGLSVSDGDYEGEGDLPPVDSRSVRGENAGGFEGSSSFSLTSEVLARISY